MTGPGRSPPATPATTAGPVVVPAALRTGPGLSQEGGGELVPSCADGAGQRAGGGGPVLSAATREVTREELESVVLPDHRLRRAPAGGPGQAPGLARKGAHHAGELDRQEHRGARCASTAEDGTPLPVFTTRPDTIYGVTFMGWPRSTRSSSACWSGSRQDSALRAFVNRVQSQSEIDRISDRGREGRDLHRGLRHPSR